MSLFLLHIQHRFHGLLQWLTLHADQPNYIQCWVIGFGRSCSFTKCHGCAVLREGLEAVVFVGGVSLGQSADSIPIAAIVGIICGLLCGFVIYAFTSRAALTVFLVVMTNFILIISAGLFSKSVGSFEKNAFNHLIGGDTDSTGDGPGTFDVRGSIWHLNCCNPENNIDGDGWLIFGALTGWTNSATIGTVLSYVFYCSG
ncbi:Iron permease FTR1 family domain containing protein [Russula decolorans]